MTDEERRDMFAAAALTGLIERRPWPVDKNESATICYQFADAMLRERAATNHDAAPAARAEVATGTGHTTREPVAWLVLDATLEPFSVHRDKVQAICDSNAFNGMIFPLYRDPLPPTLTDAEREAVEWCAVHTSGTKVGDSLRGLLARLGGGA